MAWLGSASESKAADLGGIGSLEMRGGGFNRVLGSIAT